MSLEVRICSSSSSCLRTHHVRVSCGPQQSCGHWGRGRGVVEQVCWARDRAGAGTSRGDSACCRAGRVLPNQQRRSLRKPCLRRRVGAGAADAPGSAETPGGSQRPSNGWAGSHDTMTYCLNTKSPISHEQSRLLQLLGKVLPCITRPMVLKWSITQALNITEQLDAGVRYLDLRIAHMLEGSEKNLHFVHMVYTTALVEDTLTEISEWLESHPREVVILACRNFEGMTEDLHEYLVGCIKNIFGDMLCPRGDVPTLRQLWARGQQVVLSYEDEGAVSRHQELWLGIPYWWGNKVKAQELVCYLEHMKSCGRPDGLFVAGINLTENLEYVLVHLSKSLKKMTLPSLPYLCAWVREQQPGPSGCCTNIIAGDFIGTGTFVSDVIRLNDKLLRC